MKEEIPQILKDFADAASGAAEVQNRYWLALLAFSAFVLAPRSTVGETVDLPFDLGSVERAWFSFVAVVILSVLLIGFASAHAQVVRTQKLVLALLRQRRTGGARVAGMDEREVFEALRRPGLSRVASIAQILRGEHQFFTTKSQCPLWKLWATAAVYVLLKAVAILVLFVAPAWALGLTAWRYSMAPAPPGLPVPAAVGLWLLVVSAAIAWLVALTTEVAYIVRALPALASRSENAG